MVRISDVTMKQVAEGFHLSFKEKIELAKHLDKLGASVIELEGIANTRVDSLRIKSIASAVENSIVAVPVELNPESVEQVWSALQLAASPRLQVCAPVSSVQMEYLFHKKPDAMVEAVRATVAQAAALCPTEFVADDATRSDPEFLYKIMNVAIEAGATTVTVCDTAGTMLPGEFEAFIRSLFENVPALKNITLGVSCCDTLALADACTISAVQAGAGEVKTAAYPLQNASLANVAKILSARSDVAADTGICVNQLSHTLDQITWMCQPGKGKAPQSLGSCEDAGVYLTAHDDITAVLSAAQGLGYDLSQEDGVKVYDAFCQIAAKKEQVSIRELDAIIASAAMQVPSTYKLDTFLISSGNTIAATAHMKLMKNDEPMEGVCLGDGPIDAAFQAIEKITGRHYELDDFQIQAVTEGREAMGQTVVKLRSQGKVYSGRGISTDIVGASIRAYISALNKIVYEEDEA